MPSPLEFDPIAEARRQWEARWGGDATTSMAAVTSIMRVQQIVLGRLNSLLEPHDLTFPRYEALMILFYSRRGALPLGKLSDRLQVHRASVTNVVDRLAASGYVVRESDERDRRTVLARITEAGRNTARDATEQLNATRFGMNPLDDADCEGVYLLFRRMRLAAADFVDSETPGTARR
jgi:DNA-binding MarR family transcriptional regulator